MSDEQENGHAAEHQRVMQSAADHAQETAPQLPKRFYKTVSIVREGDGYGVALDDRVVRTPGRQPLALPSERLAKAVGAEWSAQETHINPATMPFTRLSNTTIDGVSANRNDVVQDIAKFAMTDLLCYRADGPYELVVQQNDLWNPIVSWAEDTLEVRFQQTAGVMPVDQDDDISAAVVARLSETSAFVLGPLHTFTSLTGSALLALAIEAGHLDVEDAWMAAHLDEDWQISQWGEDAEAAERRTKRWQEMQIAARFLLLSRS